MISIPRHVIGILAAALMVRLAAWMVVVDPTSESYAEYGIIARYMHEGKGYSCMSSSDNVYTFRYVQHASPQPSALMMPGYTLFIYLGMFVENPSLRSLVVCGVQWMASLVVLLVLYLWCDVWLGRRIALTAAWLYALLPEFIVAANSYSSVVFVHLGVVLLCLLGTVTPARPWKSAVLVLASLLLMSLRAESLFFLMLLAAVLWYRRYRTQALCLALGVLFFLVPWTLRNYAEFERIVPLTTSAGINLYRGHNPYAVGVWSDDTLQSRIQSLPFDREIELRIDSLHTREALRTLREQPLVEFQRSLEKLIALMTIDRSDARSMHPAYLIPSLVFMMLVVVGHYRIRQSRTSIPPQVWTYLLTCVVTTTAFFCLPRYQSMMRIVLVPHVAAGIAFIISTIKSRSSS